MSILKTPVGIAWFLLIFCILSHTPCQTSPVGNDDTAPRIYKMKAVFIYNFIKFIRWPKDSVTDTFTIAVIGKSKIIPYLDQIAYSKTVNEKKIIVNHYDKPAHLQPSHILFIDNMVSIDIVKLRKHHSLQGQLIIGDRQGLTQKGFDISFYIENGRLKFELNRKNIEQSGFYISSHLLKIAKIVE